MLNDLRDTNETFYRFLETLDLDGMKGLWLPGDDARCVHPGSGAIRGYDAIIQSWDIVFRNTGWMRVTPTEIELQRLGDLGVVYCSENITAKNEDDVGVALTTATNLYRRTEEGWRMILHHASPAPVEITQPFNGTLQ